MYVFCWKWSVDICTGYHLGSGMCFIFLPTASLFLLIECNCNWEISTVSRTRFAFLLPIPTQPPRTIIFSSLLAFLYLFWQQKGNCVTMEGQRQSFFVEMKWRISGRLYWAAAPPKTWETVWYGEGHYLPASRLLPLLSSFWMQQKQENSGQSISLSSPLAYSSSIISVVSSFSLLNDSNKCQSLASNLFTSYCHIILRIEGELFILA